jgi:hypothetical protein
MPEHLHSGRRRSRLALPSVRVRDRRLARAVRGNRLAWNNVDLVVEPRVALLMERCGTLLSFERPPSAAAFSWALEPTRTLKTP